MGPTFIYFVDSTDGQDQQIRQSINSALFYINALPAFVADRFLTFCVVVLNGIKCNVDYWL